MTMQIDDIERAARGAAWNEQETREEQSATFCDDCGTTTNNHRNTCEFFGVGTWQDTYVDDDAPDTYDQVVLALGGA